MHLTSKLLLDGSDRMEGVVVGGADTHGGDESGALVVIRGQL